MSDGASTDPPPTGTGGVEAPDEEASLLPRLDVPTFADIKASTYLISKAFARLTELLDVRRN